VNTINEGRRGRQRGGKKKRGRQRKDGGKGDRGERRQRRQRRQRRRVPFEWSCLLLVFDVSEGIMLRGM